MSGNVYEFHSTHGALLGILILAVVLAFPLKAAAHFADAKRNDLVWCAVAGLIGLIAGYIADRFFGGLIGGPLAAFFGFVVAIRLMLGTSLVGSIGLTIVALGISVLGVVVLARI